MKSFFDRDKLPDPQQYFESQGLELKGRGPWRTTRCAFHGGSDSMRLNVQSGQWKCMSCLESGQDVLAYHQASHGLDFIDAAKALGAWDSTAPDSGKRRAISSHDALLVLRFEANLCAVAAGNVARGIQLDDRDRQRLMTAARRIEQIGALAS